MFLSNIYDNAKWFSNNRFFKNTKIGLNLSNNYIRFAKSFILYLNTLYYSISFLLAYLERSIAIQVPIKEVNTLKIFNFYCYI